ncbi:MAG: hypothetical protein E7036_06340 [Opitutales bacterium]|nr:hypothetical protein [Opitutales bacterium]
MKKFIFAGLLLASTSLFADHVMTVTSESKNLRDYVPPMLANGAISTRVDNLGQQVQKKYINCYPDVAWAGRRYARSERYALMTMGHYSENIIIDGKPLGKVINWEQSLNTTKAYTECIVEYENVFVKTMAFVPKNRNMLVVKKTIEPKSNNVKNAEIKFTYHLADINDDTPPARTTINTKVDDLRTNSASIFYTAQAFYEIGGEISLMSDKPSSPSVSKYATTLTTSLDISKGSADATYFISFADSYTKPESDPMITSKQKVGTIKSDYKKRSKELKNAVATKGFDGIFAEHIADWAKFWEGAFVKLPDQNMQNAYQTALYHMNSLHTEWSIPVTILSHGFGWSGKYYGWDEMFCVLGEQATGKFNLSLKTAKFRKDILKYAMYRVSYYYIWRPLAEKKFGARYAWQNLEDASEGSDTGFWNEHIFHMSNITQSVWKHYLFTGDKKYLEEIAYPVMRECAAFYLSHMVYETPERTFIGKCTDIERLGPAVENPFMTSCGVIYNFEAVARASKILGVDADYAQRLVDVAKKLRKSLPHDGEKYVPHINCDQKSIVALGGFYPYEIFDKTETKQAKALYDFMSVIKTYGNMYPLGKDVCPWYSGWASIALQQVGDNILPEQMLSATAKNAGLFGETWEIREPKIRHNPWFSTAAGIYLQSVSQMLVNPHENGNIDIAVTVPEKWKDYSFYLPSFGGAWINAEIKNGKLVKLEYTGGKNDNVKRRLVIPQYLLDNNKLPASTKKDDRYYIIEIEKNFSL